MTLKIGVTGNIGSGKTTVCRIFQTMDVPVLYADDLARRLMKERLTLRSSLLEILGSEAFLDNSDINRTFISKSIFSNEDLRLRVNKAVHHAVQAYTKRWFESLTTPYGIEEAALIFEADADKNLDYVITVDCPQSIRIQRVMDRDGISQEEALAREKVQMPAEEKREKSDFVIHNDGNQSLVLQVREIHRTLVSLSKSNDHGD
ncbi:MAG: dephospho-CoA kinase [Saprospiraceae bacterium]|nr:dephospho-CoA kinase [Saprospiraceae bacterium]